MQERVWCLDSAIQTSPILQVVVLKGESQPWVLDRQQPGVLAKSTKSWQSLV